MATMKYILFVIKEIEQGRMNKVLYVPEDALTAEDIRDIEASETSKAISKKVMSKIDARRHLEGDVKDKSRNVSAVYILWKGDGNMVARNITQLPCQLTYSDTVYTHQVLGLYNNKDKKTAYINNYDDIQIK